MPGGIVVFAALQFVLVAVVHQRKRDFVEGNGDVKQPTNTLSNAGSDAVPSTVVLRSNDPVVRRHRVGATVTPAWVATVARPPCLG